MIRFMLCAVQQPQLQRESIPIERACGHCIDGPVVLAEPEAKRSWVLTGHALVSRPTGSRPRSAAQHLLRFSSWALFLRSCIRVDGAAVRAVSGRPGGLVLARARLWRPAASRPGRRKHICCPCPTLPAARRSDISDHIRCTNLLNFATLDLASCMSLLKL